VGELRIGTSGWSYPAGKGTWNGVFYPPRKGRASTVPGFDELSYYAEHFDTVEINSSFYGTPRKDVSRGWADRTPPRFEFSLKLYQKFTHPRMYKASHLGDLPATSEELDALARINRADIDAFKTGIEPLAARHKLGALLAQFPPSFKDSPESRAYLHWLLQVFREYPVAVELRHRTWSDNVAGTLTLLNELGAAWTQIDEPKFKTSIRQNQLPNVRTFYYMRLHGRNAAQWWKHDSTEDRYNYLYSEEELTPIAETATAARALVKKAYLYMNNHFAAKSVANAVMVKHLTHEAIDGEYPHELVTRYPELARLVKATVEWTPARQPSVEAGATLLPEPEPVRKPRSS
jgi:uncharacterized protein YecE (DUF72 family)